jgi:hypothetical protein
VGLLGLAPPFSGDPAATFVHLGGGTSANRQVVSSSLKFLFQLGVFLGGSWVTPGDTEVVVGSSVLTDVLKGGAEVTVLVARQLRE